ncbi:hypothetical protein BaRGS_00040513 [Batillaria attramentaria]|uniref:TIR domain-containing protein n=1 Tax=Batillaria attramentaria TaxID=370345 RepID=A0ABD0IZT7_9CAEN
MACAAKETKSQQCVYDAILFHTDEEVEEARKFCQLIREHGQNTGRPLKIETFEDFSDIGKQEIENLNDAVEQAKLILCSQSFYTDDAMGAFSANTALHHKMAENQFIQLKIGHGTAEADHVMVDSLKKFKITSDWEFCSDMDKEKMVRRIAGGRVGTTALESKSQGRSAAVKEKKSQVTSITDSALASHDLAEDATPDSMPPKPQHQSPETVSHTSGTTQVPSANPKVLETGKVNKKLKAQQVNKSYSLDAVILHSEEEKEHAENFCEILEKCSSDSGRSLQIKTLESVSDPAKQEIENFNTAIGQAKVVICSDDFHTGDKVDRRYANAALHHKIPDSRFFLLYVGQKSTENASISSLKGMKMSPNWDFVCEKDKLKLVDYLKAEDGPGNRSGNTADAASPAGHSSTREHCNDDPTPFQETDSRAEQICQQQNASDLRPGETGNADEDHLSLANLSITSDFSSSFFASWLEGATENDQTGSADLPSQIGDRSNADEEHLSLANMSETSIDSSLALDSPYQASSVSPEHRMIPADAESVPALDNSQLGGPSATMASSPSGTEIQRAEDQPAPDQVADASAGDTNTPLTLSLNSRENSMNSLPSDSLVEDAASIVTGADFETADFDQTHPKQIHAFPDTQANRNTVGSQALNSLLPERQPPEGACAPQEPPRADVHPPRYVRQVVPQVEFLDELTEEDREEVRDHLL